MGAPQNIYDDPEFFTGYQRLRRTGSGLNEVLEQPALRSLLPESLEGLRVLDVGCGFGDFARHARLCGARAVVGIDPSARMLAQAAAATTGPGIQYLRQSVEALDLPGEPFDLVVSSLALHYVADYPAALGRMAALMRPGGRLVFSVEHPICTARAEQRWVRDADGQALYWPVDDYRKEGPRSTTWFVAEVVKYHRTVESYVNGVLQAGFRLRALLEPEPRPGAEGIPGLELHRRRPPFLLLAAEREEPTAAG